MNDNTIFAKHVKALRSSHNLSYQIVGDVLGLSKTAYKAWETTNSYASFDMLNKICKLFAVSSDWLLGFSDEPYKENLILNLERDLLESKITIKNNEEKLPFIFVFDHTKFPHEYIDERLRKENYTLAMRANIVFCLNIERAFLECNLAKAANTAEVIRSQPFFADLDKDNTFKKREKLHNVFKDFKYQLLLRNNGYEPCFDVIRYEKENLSQP